MKSKSLRKLLSLEQPLVMPDAYDPISALMIQKAGFKAVQCSGYSFSVAASYSRESDVSLEENLEITRRIVEAVDVPVMADAEDGYGGPEAVIETVSRFIEIGVAGMNLEDQVLGTGGLLQIISEDLMGEKIMVARETAEIEGNPALVINGRTDALKSLNNREDAMNLSIERANQYLDDGADLVFITYVETLDEVETIIKEVKGPVSIAAGMPYNIKNFSIADLDRLGVARVSIPTLLIYSSLKALKGSLEYLKKDKLMDLMEESCLISSEDLNDILS
ncbi:isocitrate lyase/phosphoenolpyruvate mutase family protein [Methanobacterium sp. CWC-01]|uniref:isocitrate lyase/PEP mutase family protein n=1 Tax=Methanobacterium aridiramus TaxID=2584467 RepID=UPI002576175D|nr:isocitrate lyase/phosphoenolpyruvate mutase family protein [Methanobacterium sp. CWC-01]WJI09632.1 isocitrate lyase/phosphoenolpyruvate mutase family protein [Methanobacterium sp. CWC-01]